jgi:hypothetical protein
MRKFLKYTKRTFEVIVEFEKSIEELLVLGKYDRADLDINSKHFLARRTRNVRTIIDLIHFDSILSSDDALVVLHKMGYRPADAYELLTLGIKYPDVQREIRIVALGAVRQFPRGDHWVLYLSADGPERLAVFNWSQYDYGGRRYFAAVRKISRAKRKVALKQANDANRQLLQAGPCGGGG